MTQTDARHHCSTLERLFAEQRRSGPPNGYLDVHGRPEAIKHHVNLFCWYRQFLPDGGTMLDWGCSYGPDSCLLRETYGDRVDLHSCDFTPASRFEAFRAFARARYTQLTHVVDLPYPDDTFDVVIGSGVLEHTAMDGESLKALYRILKPGGVLVISYLPYHRSYHEWYLRTFRGRGHRRLYGRRQLTRLFQHHGFEPLAVRFQTFVPNLVEGKATSWLKRLYAHFRYPSFTHAVLCGVARKVLSM
jgi:SAM-dependent methyltransferase